MPMPIHAELDSHLRRVVGNTGYSTSGNSATIPTASVDHRRIAELIEVATTLKHEVSLASGVLTIKPK